MLALAVSLWAAAAGATPPEWSKPVPPVRIAANVDYVGTAELGCYLLRGSKGDVLLNTGLADSPPLILASLKALGEDPARIKLLLVNQAHFDHAGGLAELQRLTGAPVYATAADAPLLEDGGASDPGDLPRFAPVKVARRLKDGEDVTLGDLTLKVVATPGHTPGSVSYLLTLRDGRTLLFANLPTVVMPLKNPRYPGIAADLRASLARLEALHPDLWVAAHASQFDLEAKRASGNFADPAGYARAVAEARAAFEAKAKAELGAARGPEPARLSHPRSP